MAGIRTADENVPADPATVLAQIDSYSRHSTLARLPSLRVPTLVVHGDSDRVVDLADAVELTRAIPGASLRVLSAGHFFWLEEPEQTVQLIADFCETANNETANDLRTESEDDDSATRF